MSDARFESRPFLPVTGPLWTTCAAVLAGPRPDVDDVVGRADRLLVVLDDDDRVAEVAEPQQRLDEPLVVPLVEADRRLVEDVEDADEPAADLAGQADPLRLAARQRRRRPGQRQVVEADVEQELHPLADLLQHPVGDQVVALGQLEAGDGVDRLGDRQAAQLVDAHATDRHRQRLRLEPRPAAGRAGDLAHVLLDLLARPVRVGLAVPALEPRDDALVVRHVRPAATEPVAVLHVDLLRSRAVEDELAVLGLQLRPRRLDREAAEVGDAGDQAGEVLAACPRPRAQRAVGQRERRVRHDELRVDLELRAEPRTGRARAVRRVEREAPRRRLLEADPAVCAGQVLAERDRLVAVDLPVDPARHRPSCRSSPAATPRPAAGETTTSAVPPDRPRAVSIDSVSRWRMPSRRTSRSTTTSIVCCS